MVIRYNKVDERITRFCTKNKKKLKLEINYFVKFNNFSIILICKPVVTRLERVGVNQVKGNSPKVAKKKSKIFLQIIFKVFK